MAELKTAPDFERDSELLPRGLPSLAMRCFAIFLIVLVGVVAIVCMYVRVPESVHCRFVLVSENGANPVTAPRRGIVERVNITDGSEVKRGDTLLVIRSDELRVLAERASLDRELESNRERLLELKNENTARRLADEASKVEIQARITRLEREREKTTVQDQALIERHKLTLDAAKSKAAGVANEAELERKRVVIAKELFARVEDSLKKGIMPEWEALRERYAYQQADLILAQALNRASEMQLDIARVEATTRLEISERALAISRLDGEIAETKAALQRLISDNAAREALSQDRMRQLGAQISTSEVQQTSLVRELDGTTGDLMKIVAPYDGAVIKLGPQRAGVVIERGQVLCELAQAGAKLHAELNVPEADAGLLAAGQKARLLYAAFPYTRYGARNAVVSWMSPAGAEGNFRALASLENDSVIVNGKSRPLSAGMGGEARVEVARRTIIEFVFEPLRQIRENLR